MSKSRGKKEKKEGRLRERKRTTDLESNKVKQNKWKTVDKRANSINVI